MKPTVMDVDRIHLDLGTMPASRSHSLDTQLAHALAYSISAPLAGQLRQAGWPPSWERAVTSALLPALLQAMRVGEEQP